MRSPVFFFLFQKFVMRKVGFYLREHLGHFLTLSLLKAGRLYILLFSRYKDLWFWFKPHNAKARWKLHLKYC